LGKRQKRWKTLGGPRNHEAEDKAMRRSLYIHISRFGPINSQFRRTIASHLLVWTPEDPRSKITFLPLGFFALWRSPIISEKEHDRYEYHVARVPYGMELGLFFISCRPSGRARRLSVVELKRSMSFWTHISNMKHQSEAIVYCSQTQTVLFPPCDYMVIADRRSTFLLRSRLE